MTVVQLHMTDKSRFISFNDNFNSENHFIELADGSRINSIALKKGSACISLIDSEGNKQNYILKDTLNISLSKQDTQG